MQQKPLAIGAIILSILAIILSFFQFRKVTINNGAVVDTLARIQTTKKMNICYAVWPPAVIKDAVTGKLSGHDIDALTMMADQIGVKPEFYETTFGNMAAAVQSGQCDIGTSLYIKIPRAAAVAFSRPVFYGGNSGLVKKGDTRFETIDDVDKPGIKVAVATGESGHIYAKEHFINAQIIPIDVESSDLSRFLTEVSAGRADIGIADANTIHLYAVAHPETTDVFASQPFDINPDAYPLRHGDLNFLNFVNNSLLYMETSGVWDSLEKKYNAHWLHEVKQYQIR